MSPAGVCRRAGGRSRQFRYRPLRPHPAGAGRPPRGSSSTETATATESAASRPSAAGLLNLRTTPEALKRYDDPKNVALFARHGVYTRTEIQSRQDINVEEYAKIIHIEALTLIDMLGKLIVPACAAYSKQLAEGVAAKAGIGVDARRGGRAGQAADREDGRADRADGAAQGRCRRRAGGAQRARDV